MLARFFMSMAVRRSSRVSSLTIAAASENATTAANVSKKHLASSPAHGAKTKRSKPAEEPEFKVPVTPVKKARRGPKPSKIPPLTPTPSLVNAIREPYRPANLDNATPPPDRPVGPHITNAPLVTPGGTQKVAYPDDASESTPSKIGRPPPTATTNTLLEKACTHLISVDARLKPVIEKHTCHIFSAKGLAEKIDPFRSLSSGIIGQQVSGAAAKSIKNKFIALFNEGAPDNSRFPSPAEVAATDLPKLRLAGLSQRKAEYIQGLAEKFTTRELTTDMLMTATDEEVMEKLIAVRGLGKWSVEMFACFGLKRLDILSTGDLGVQRGMAAFYGKDVKKLKAKGGGKWKYMSEQDMLEKSAPFAPYRSLYMWYMWRVEDVDVEVMEGSM